MPNPDKPYSYFKLFDPLRLLHGYSRVIWESRQWWERSRISRPNIQKNCRVKLWKSSPHGSILGRHAAALYSYSVYSLNGPQRRKDWTSNLNVEWAKVKHFLTTYLNNIWMFLGEIFTFHIIRILITTLLQIIVSSELTLLKHGLAVLISEGKCRR